MTNLFSWASLLFAGWVSVGSLQTDSTGEKQALWINQKKLHLNDTLSFEWDGSVIGKPYPAATMHVWADHLESGRRWKFRYPILNGFSEGDLLLGKGLPAGTYALNFLASDQFFMVKGSVKSVKIKTAMNHQTRKRDTVAVFEQAKLTDGEMSYHLLGKEGILHTDKLTLDAEGRFRIPGIVFGDTAQLVFNPAKSKGTYWIDLETPLDSSFTPFYSETVFVQLEGEAEKQQATVVADTTAYSFDMADPKYTTMMPEITIKGKTNAEKFEDEFVSGLFKDAPGVRTINALDDELLMRSNDIFLYLRNNVAGLMMQTNGISRSFTWRGDPVQFFLNEFPVDADAIATLAPMDIAMIKVYPPPAQVSSLVFGGAVAVYTKRGAYEKDPTRPRYNFMVKGYTQGESWWEGQ